MRRWVTLLASFVLVLSHSAMSAPATLRVLFVGNSLTYYNALPSMVVSAAAKSHRPVRIDVEMLAAPGASIRQNIDAGQLGRVIEAGHFDYVVLQEIGGFPLCSEDFPGCKGSLDSLGEAAKLVRRGGARVILLATYTTLGDGQAGLSLASQTLAEGLKSDWFDWGKAIVKAGERDPALATVGRDQHPSAAGSWLAALGVAQLITGVPIAHRPDRVCAQDWSHAMPPLSNARLASQQRTSTVNCFELSDSTYSILKPAAARAVKQVIP